MTCVKFEEWGETLIFRSHSITKCGVIQGNRTRMSWMHKEGHLLEPLFPNWTMEKVGWAASASNIFHWSRRWFNLGTSWWKMTSYTWSTALAVSKPAHVLTWNVMSSVFKSITDCYVGWAKGISKNICWVGLLILLLRERTGKERANDWVGLNVK